MPVLNGMEAARVIKSDSLQSAIVILSSHADKHLVEVAKEAGAKACVAKARIGAAFDSRCKMGCGRNIRSGKLFGARWRFTKLPT